MRTSPKRHLSQVMNTLEHLVATGGILVNQKGALIHVTGQGPGLVIPEGYRMLARSLQTTPGAIETVLDAISIPSKAYGIQRPKSYIKIRLCILDATHCPFLSDFDVNPDIVIIQKKPKHPSLIHSDITTG